MGRIQSVKNRLLKSELFKDSFWALSGNVVGRGLALLASIFVARYLGKDMFGMYALIRTTLLSVAVFSTFGLGYTATKFIAEYSKKSPTKIKSIIDDITQITLITGGIFAVLIFVFSKQLAGYLDSGDLYESIRYLAAIIVFNSIATSQSGILSGFKKFKQLAKINIINGLITFLLSVGLTYYYSLNGALIALLISQAYNCIQNWVEVRKSIKDIGLQHSKSSIRKELLLFSAPVALQEMIYSISIWVFPILLIKFSNIGEVGLYNAAAQWSAVILFIPFGLRTLFFSYLSVVNDNIAQQRILLQRMVLINFGTTFISFMIIFLFTGLIVGAYGSSFVSLGVVLNISIFTSIITSISGCFHNFLLSSNNPWITFFHRLGEYVLTAMIAVLIMKHFNNDSGAKNLAIASLCSQLIILLLLLFQVKRIFKKTN